MNFKYKWWGKGDFEATIGVFFDGFSKIMSATGIMIFSLGMPSSLVIGKILPAIGFSVLFGNIWYFFEAVDLAKKTKKQDVTAQPFGLGASQVMSWLFLIMGPVYWSTKDALLSYQVGLAACFIGGLFEVGGAFFGKFLARIIPTSALMGNLAGSALIWLSVVGIITVYDNPLIALLPLMIVLVDYVGGGAKRFRVPTGIIAIVLGTIIAWVTKSIDIQAIVSSTSDIGLYYPGFFVGDIIKGLKGCVPYLPIIIPMQLGNTISTLQGVESAKQGGDIYPERRSMLIDGISTVIGPILGNPFPTTVYYGHPGWKKLGARAGYSLGVGVLTILICCTGLTGIIMNIIPYEVVIILLVFVGITVAAETFSSAPKKEHSIVLISLIPILFQYIYSQIETICEAITGAGIPFEVLENAAIPIKGMKSMSDGAFLTSILLATILAFVIKKEYTKGAISAVLMAGFASIGMIHNSSVALFPEGSLVYVVAYMLTAIYIYQKNWIKPKKEEVKLND